MCDYCRGPNHLNRKAMGDSRGSVLPAELVQIDIPPLREREAGLPLLFPFRPDRRVSLRCESIPLDAAQSAP